jgi:hypothetical protein
VAEPTSLSLSTSRLSMWVVSFHHDVPPSSKAQVNGASWSSTWSPRTMSQNKPLCTSFIACLVFHFRDGKLTCTRFYYILYYKKSRDDLKYARGCVQVICKYYSTLYKGLEHPLTLIFTGDLEPIPMDVNI